MSAHRCALLSALTVAAGCFSDGGAALTQPVTTEEPVPSTSSQATSTTTAASTSTGGLETTTSGMVTDPGSTSEPLACDDMFCEPGDLDDFGLCDPCGRLLSTCQPDCTWSAPVCTPDLSSCAYWSLDLGGAGWTRHALPQPLPEHAPSEPVAAAFELAASKQLVALTQTRYHVLTPADGAWVASGPLADMLPGFPGPVLQAYAIHDPVEGHDVITVSFGATVNIYSLPVGELAATFAQEAPCCDSWNDLVDPGDITIVRDLFVDLDNLSNWPPAEVLNPFCMNAPLTLTSYGAWIAPETVYLQEIGTCFELVHELPYLSFPPFALADAPPGDLVGGAALLDGAFYVFVGD